MNRAELLAGVAFCLACWLVTIAIAIGVSATVNVLQTPPQVKACIEGMNDE